MKVEAINLRKDNPKIKLTAYQLSHKLGDRKDIVRPAVLICPGGGYTFLSDREAEPIAMKFLSKGYNAFILDYSVKGDAKYPNPLYDAANAIYTIRTNAEKWNIDKDKICVCGFSAGGHVAASLGVYWNHEFVKKELGIKDSEMIKPNGMILGYPLLDIATFTPEYFSDKPDLIEHGERCLDALFGTNEPDPKQMDSVSLYKHVSSDTPKTFMWHTYEDGLVAVDNVLDFSKALAQNDVAFEMHIFQNGGHGLACVDKTTNMGIDMGTAARYSIWFDLALAWMDDNLPFEI